MSEAVLKKFGVTEVNQIGHGGESHVYSLPEQKLLRVYKEGGVEKQEFLHMLKVLYGGIYGKFSFKTPLILEIGTLDGVLYSINELIEGRPMHEVLPELNPAQKKILYESYFSAMEEIRSVVFPERPYGEILGSDPVTAPTWTEFLEKSIRRRAQENERYLGNDIEHFPELVERIVLEAHKQPALPEKSFVHGDIFPNNVLVNTNLEVCGIIDMSFLSVVGDYMMDVASSYVFLETTPNTSTEDSEIYRPIIVARYGEGVQKAFDFYALYYSIYFGMKEGTEYETYPGMYDWIVKTLKAFQRTG